MVKISTIGLAISCVFVRSNALAQTVECSSPTLLQDLQRQLQSSFAPPAINSISAIARGQQPVSARVQIVSIDTVSQTGNLQKCSVVARILRDDLRRPINVTARYTIYNRSMTGGFDVVVSPEAE